MNIISVYPHDDMDDMVNIKMGLEKGLELCLEELRISINEQICLQHGILYSGS